MNESGIDTFAKIIQAEEEEPDRLTTMYVASQARKVMRPPVPNIQGKKTISNSVDIRRLNVIQFDLI